MHFGYIKHIPDAMKNLCVLLFLLFCTFSALAQTSEPPTLVTDRPDQTESAVVIPVNHLQIETGAIYTKINDAVTEFQYNNSLFRYGVLPWLELRLGQAYGRQEIGLDGLAYEEEGFYPVTLGTKVHLLEERGLVPKTALLYDVELPTGSRAFMPEDPVHAFRALFSYTLNDWVDLGYNLGVIFPDELNKTTTVYTVSFGLKMTDRLTAFAEAYGFLQNDIENRHLVDGGFTYLVRPNLQVDLSGGAGLTESADDGFVSAGLAWRIPH